MQVKRKKSKVGRPAVGDGFRGNLAERWTVGEGRVVGGDRLGRLPERCDHCRPPTTRMTRDNARPVISLGKPPASRIFANSFPGEAATAILWQNPYRPTPSYFCLFTFDLPPPLSARSRKLAVQRRDDRFFGRQIASFDDPSIGRLLTHHQAQIALERIVLLECRRACPR